MNVEGVDLSVEVGGIRLRNPTMLASGILGDRPSLISRVCEAGAGGVVTKSITREPLPGYGTPIIVATKCGYLNAVGLANPGKGAIRELVKAGKERGVPVIVSIAGSSVEEFVELAEEARESGADGVELNLSCPHAKGRGLELSDDPKLVAEIISTVKDEVDIRVFPKLGLRDNLLSLAEVAEESGADGIVLINTVRGMKIDVWTARPVLSNRFGGLSGPAIHPIAVRAVYEVYERVSLPIIGVGGVDGWEPAVELMLAGASAVQIGSAIAYRGLSVFREVAEGIAYYLKEMGFSSVREIVGLAHA